MAQPASDFMIVPRRPRARWRWTLLTLAWLASLALVALVVHRWSVPLLGESMDQLDALNEENLALQVKLETALQKNAVLSRAEQVNREALAQLQASLSEREEEIASLRADVGFYERLVGGSAKRQGLAVHSVVFEPGASGDLRYEITLTQNIKRSGLTEGDLTFSVEGVADGALKVLGWRELNPQRDGAPRPFSFRYFQQLSGSIMLPDGFQPQRVRVRLTREGADVDQTIPWEDTRRQAGA
ncbi:DUF6776 family protein [Pseudomarimonas salicorniae]|uniref:Transmembrane protein n=1 Tax=Pseudomarimonas salicorniae TaxID=2933270 RepID=A0ABT0GCE1_9GAMM|nr:DUF6776 family protein [Lysobacter sp. CAU 1642]MCK7592208.1 hypothetical protein [Lysobacter sp. CAU 1642]